MSFEQNLEKYAEVLVKVGVNLQPGQRLVLPAPVEGRELVHAVTRQAYRVGAALVDVVWTDSIVNKIRLQEAAQDTLDIAPDWIFQHWVDMADAGEAVLSINGGDPDLMAGIDSNRLKIYTKAERQARRTLGERISAMKMNWSIGMTPHPALAAKIFPDLSTDEAVARLWDVIFEMCRITVNGVTSADPVDLWQAHVKSLTARSQYLTDKAFTALQYTAPGTNLRIGLPNHHIWQGAGAEAQNGIFCVPNIPTEEIFTMPHKDQIDGVVSSTKPLVLNGTLIDKFTLQFSEGQVVSVKAETGQKVLEDQINMDEDARSLGEIALVPHSSPISQSGLIFFNTLYDENASSHLALGRAYRFSMAGGVQMTEAEFSAAGGNTSLIHVDFMMGSDQMNIDGITANGTSEAIMRDGEWAFEA